MPAMIDRPDHAENLAGAASDAASGPPAGAPSAATAPVWAIMSLSFLASLGSGVLWSGLAFVAKHAYGFDQATTFLLYLVSGVVYVAGAFGAGPLSRALERWLSPRAVVMAAFALQAVICPLVLIPDAPWALWSAAIAASFVAAVLWPIVEAYVAAGRHGPAMRSTLGWWNIVWTGAVAVSMLLMAPLVAADAAQWTLVGLAPVSVACIVIMAWFPPAPPPHDDVLADASTTPEYPSLLRTGRILLPASYLLIGALSPIMPFRLAALGAAPGTETPMTAIWMIARVVALAIMWRSTFWHGRWGTLVFGGAVMTLGFAGVVAAPTLSVLGVSLALFGAAQGIVYYAAIYYAMSVGRAAVDAGGTHEGLIGVGYALGPTAGLVGLMIGGASNGPAWTIVVTWTMLAFAAPSTVTPYLAARRRRRVR